METVAFRRKYNDKSLPPHTDPRDAVPGAHRVVHRCRRSMWWTDRWRSSNLPHWPSTSVDSNWDDQPFQRYGWCPPKFKWFTRDLTTVTLLEFRRDFWRQKTRLPGLSYGVVCVILHLAVLVQCQRGTDGRTDGQTHDDRIYRASIASRGTRCKNGWK